MAIKNIQTVQTGLVGVLPSLAYIYTSDTEAQVLTTGYLNHEVQQGVQFSMPCIAVVSTQATPTSQPQVGWYQVAHVGANWSLVPAGNPGDVVLPTIANHIATYTTVTGTLGEDAATAINGGNLQAGLSGTAGTVASFPATAANGSLILAAVNAGGAFNTTISNGTMAQSCVYTIPDVTAATGQFLVKTAALVSGNLVQASGTAGVTVDSGIVASNVQLKSQVIAQTSADIGGAGAGPFTITVAGMTAASVVVATIETSSNTVAVAKATAGTGNFDILFTADPGAVCTVNYVAYISAQ